MAEIAGKNDIADAGTAAVHADRTKLAQAFDYASADDRAMYREVLKPLAQPNSSAEFAFVPSIDSPVTHHAAARQKVHRPKACPSNPDYERIVETAWNNMYDPSKLGSLHTLKHKFDCQLMRNPGAVVRYANEALKVANDPYTKVADAKETAKYEEDSKGVFNGFGFTWDVEVGKKKPQPESPLIVTGTVSNSAAEKAGIKKGDVVTAVDGHSLKGKPFDLASRLVTTDKAHKFTILRDGKKMEFDIAPEAVEVKNITDKRVDGNIAYIRLEDWEQEDTADDIKRALERHKDASGYIIDLRDNGGGFFDQAIKAAALFVKDGVIVSTKQRIDPNDLLDDKLKKKVLYEKITYSVDSTGLKTKTTNDADGGESAVTQEERLPDMVDKPTIILVNGDTASASEVFTAALKQNGDAQVFGSRTYGKGIGQNVILHMPKESSLRVTNFRYFTPKGNWLGDGHLDRRGIQPDRVVLNPSDADFGSDRDRQLKVAIESIKKRTQK